MIVIIIALSFAIGMIIGYFLGLNKHTHIQVGGDNSVQTQVTNSDDLSR